MSAPSVSGNSATPVLEETAGSHDEHGAAAETTPNAGAGLSAESAPAGARDDAAAPALAPATPRPGFDERGHLLGVSAVPFNPCADDPACPDLALKRAMMRSRRTP